MSTPRTASSPAAYPDGHGIEHAIEELRKGRMIIVTDDADREGEGDLSVTGAWYLRMASTMSWNARTMIFCRRRFTSSTSQNRPSWFCTHSK